MINITNKLEDWLSQRNLWMQNAMNRIIRNEKINENDITELVELCKKEAGVLKDIDNELKPIKFSNTQHDDKEIQPHLVIDSIYNLKGMFALSPKKPLKLGNESLTVVYGRNGSGKSSYVKILKHMCGARNPGKLLNNVFEENSKIKSCNVDIKIGDKQEKIFWKQEDGVHNKLKEIEIYDTDCANVYVNSENEVAYEPRVLTLLTNISDVCLKVGEKIENEINNSISKKSLLPKEYINTNSGKWYSNLSLESINDLDSKLQWNHELDKELKTLKNRLDVSNPLEQSKILRNRILSLDKLIKNIEVLTIGLSDGICEQYFSLKNDVNIKRKVARDDVDKVLCSTSLEGIGTESWKLLWEHAREYSQKLAYTDKVFPNVSEDAKCVLCQQTLNTESKKKLISFEEYIKGNIQKQAEESENKFRIFNEKIVNIPDDGVVDLLIGSSGIVDEEQIALIKSIFKNFRLRKSSLSSAKSILDISKIPNTEILKYYKMKIKAFEESACTLELDAKNDSKEDIQKKVCELEAQKWIYQQKESIEGEVQRLKLINGLKKAKKLTNTQAISLKKSELSNVLVTEEYMNRFEKELKFLGAHQLKVELVKTRTQKGHIFHQIKLKNCKKNIKAADVLSEGEMRIVSLAAFLADVAGRKNNTPFIFDDPISSLDQEYEEATVARLIELSKNRQVIVFTHRLSLLTLIEESTKKQNVKTSIISLRSEYWSAGEPNETPINVKRPEKALNVYDTLKVSQILIENSPRGNI